MNALRCILLDHWFEEDAVSTNQLISVREPGLNINIEENIHSWYPVR